MCITNFLCAILWKLVSEIAVLSEDIVQCYWTLSTSQADTRAIYCLDRGFKSTLGVSLVIDGRNMANPLIDYTARLEEWRHLLNNIDKIDGSHFQ